MQRERVRALVESRAFQTFIVIVIVTNAIGIGIQTGHLSEQVDTALKIFDWICLGIYIAEAALKLFAYGSSYFKDGWNIFDFSIIVISLIPYSLLPIPVQVARILRLLRLARMFKLVSAFRQLRIIIEAVGRAMSGVAWTALLLVLVMYIFDIAGVSLFGEAFPEYFGDLGKGLFTLFQLVTLEGWADVAQDVMQVSPAAWAYFVPYVIISAFIMVNVVLGIILNAIEESTQAERINRQDTEEAQLETELAELKAQIGTVQYLLEKKNR